MKRLCMTMLALCAAVSAAYGGTTYYLKAGATDFSVASSYTKDEAGTQTATTAPGASDEVYVPAVANCGERECGTITQTER